MWALLLYLVILFLSFYVLVSINYDYFSALVLSATLAYISFSFFVEPGALFHGNSLTFIYYVIGIVTLLLVLIYAYNQALRSRI